MHSFEGLTVMLTKRGEAWGGLNELGQSPQGLSILESRVLKKYEKYLTTRGNLMYISTHALKLLILKIFKEV